MSATDFETGQLFSVRAEVWISASPERVYAVVSDLARSSEWSPECTGGRWVTGEPGTVGAVFRGDNRRAENVVSWAPVVRGEWSTESEVIAAEPGRVFRWAMRDSSGNAQDSVWSFEIERADEGCVLVHHFRMGEPTEGIRGITADMSDADRTRFVSDWAAKLERDLQDTVRRIKAVIEP